MASWGSLGPRDRRRARARWSASSGRGSTRRCTAARSPRACRPPRTSTRTASSTRVVPPDEIARHPATGRSTVLVRAPVPRRRTEPGRPTPIADVDTWDVVTRSRRPDRPGVRRLLRYAATDVIPLNGTGAGRGRPGAAARAGPVRRRAVRVPRPGPARPDRRPTRSGPARCARPAAACGWPPSCDLPLVTVIDTPGAALSVEAEEGGLAGEIARCLADLVTLDAPTLCLLLGEGTGGGALALLPADRVIAAQHAWLSPLPPEGASAIVHRDLDHAPEMARAQGVRVAGPARGRHRRPDRGRAARTPPTSRRSSAPGSRTCCATSWPRCCSATRATGHRRPRRATRTRPRPWEGDVLLEAAHGPERLGLGLARGGRGRGTR